MAGRFEGRTVVVAAVPALVLDEDRLRRRLWLVMIAVLALSLAATVGLLAWLWLGPSSGTVAH